MTNILIMTDLKKMFYHSPLLEGRDLHHRVFHHRWVKHVLHMHSWLVTGPVTRVQPLCGVCWRSGEGGGPVPVLGSAWGWQQSLPSVCQQLGHLSSWLGNKQTVGCVTEEEEEWQGGGGRGGGGPVPALGSASNHANILQSTGHSSPPKIYVD